MHSITLTSYFFNTSLIFFQMQSVDYDVGDILEILPGQSSEALDAFMRRCNLDPESYITVGISLI